MNNVGHHTPYHPKWYRRPMPVGWWLQNRSYTVFVLREVTSVFVAVFAVVSLWQVRALAEGPDPYAQFVARLRTPPFVLLHGVTLVLVLFHAITWFNAAPKAMVVRLGGRRVPDWIIAASHYVACLLLSGAVTWILLRG